MERIEPAAVGRFGRLGSFGRFLTSGAFNTLATYLLYLGLLTRLSYRVSFTIAFACGIGLAYAMNRYLVFRQPGGRRGPLWVTLIYAGQYLLNLALVSAWVQWLSAPAALAPLFAIALTLPLTYLLNRRVFSAGASGNAPMPPPGSTLKPLQWWRRRIAMVVLVGLPILSLALNAIAWLRYGFDLPFFDDWRGYDSGEIDSFDLLYLFRAANDTLTPIGYALDATAQRFLDGNSIAYQLLSMLAVLGLLLVLQWKLLRAALQDPLQAALCFVFTLLMLQPGSYWGRENLAYQQALPLVFILLALWLAMTAPWRERWNIPVIFALGLLSGFTYISGAFGALAAGAGVMLMARLSGASQVRKLRAGASLCLAGVATSWVQVVYAIAPYKGGTYTGQPLALPLEANFWFYLLGKVGRSLLLPASQPVLSLALVLLVLCLLVVVTILTLGAARSAQATNDGQARVSVIFGAIGAMVFTYLLLLSAGRTNYRAVEIQAPTEVFAYGFQRFHFFWATLLWPWLVAAALVAADRRVTSTLMRRWLRMVGAVALATTVVLMIRLGALAHFAAHRAEAYSRNRTVECLMTQLQRGEGIIHCDEWLKDLAPAFIYARQIGASFVRYFPILPIELGVDSPSPWFRLSRDGDRATARNMERRSGRYYPSTDDPQLHIDVGHAVGMANCVTLDISGVIKTAGPDTMMLFYRPLGQSDFSSASSTILPLVGGPQASAFSFRLEQDLGFGNTLRLDPVSSLQEFELGEIEVRCRLRDREDAAAPFYAMTGTAIPAALHNLEPGGDGEGRFRAGTHPSVVFRTGRPKTMASCGVIEVEPIYQVETQDVAQLFFRPHGVDQFSERNSISKPVSPRSKPEKVALVVRSASGFEDELRLEPVKSPQALRFADIQVRCLKRISPPSRR